MNSIDRSNENIPLLKEVEKALKGVLDARGQLTSLIGMEEEDNRKKREHDDAIQEAIERLENHNDSNPAWLYLAHQRPGQFPSALWSSTLSDIETQKGDDGKPTVLFAKLMFRGRLAKALGEALTSEEGAEAQASFLREFAALLDNARGKLKNEDSEQQRIEFTGDKQVAISRFSDEELQELLGEFTHLHATHSCGGSEGAIEKAVLGAQVKLVQYELNLRKGKK